MRKVVRTIVVAVGALAALMAAWVGGFAAWFYARQAIRLRNQTGERHRYPEWAAEHGLRYAEHDEELLTSLVHDNDAPFHEVHTLPCRVNHVFSHPTDARAPAFLELTMTPGPGTRPTTYFTLAAARLPAPVRDTAIIPRTRAASQKHSVIGDPAFDAAYMVRTDDPTRARQMLGPGARQWLLAFPDRARPNVRLKGEWAVWMGEGPLVFESAKRGFDALIGFLDRMDEQS